MAVAKIVPLAQVLNITVIQGTTFRGVLTVKSGGVPTDLMGYTFKGQAKLLEGLSQPTAFSFTVAKRDQTSFPGQVDVEIAAAATAALTLKKKQDYFYNILMTDPSGKIDAIFTGKVTVLLGTSA